VIGVTADTNIYISALEFGGQPLQVLVAARRGLIRLDIFQLVARRNQPRPQGQIRMEPGQAPKARAAAFPLHLASRPTQTIDAVPADPDDNRVLECAVEAQSQFIVTGDAALLRLGQYGGIQIVRVADFIKLISP
jgi:hypothetical protein